MSRRRSFRVELDGFLPKAWSLEFESSLILQISGVSPEINETVLPSAEGPGEAAQSALTAGSTTHEQATIHAVADVLESRGSTPADDVADQIPRGSPCGNQQTERVEEPGHRRDLALLDKATLTNIPGLELSQRERRNRPARRVRHHALEPHSFRSRLQKQRAGNPCGDSPSFAASIGGRFLLSSADVVIRLKTPRTSRRISL